MSRYNDLLVWDNRMEPPYDGWDFFRLAAIRRQSTS